MHLTKRGGHKKCPKIEFQQSHTKKAPSSKIIHRVKEIKRKMKVH